MYGHMYRHVQGSYVSILSSGMHICMGKVYLWGIQFSVQGAGSKVQDAWCGVQGAECRVQVGCKASY